MRILMVAHSFPRSEADVAGAFIWRLAEALTAREHQVAVIAPADRGDVGATMLGHVRVRRVRYASPRRETLAYSGAMQKGAASPLGALAFAGLIRAFRNAVEDEVRAGGVQVIHAHWWVPGALAVRLADRGGRPFLVTLHGSDVRLARRVPGARRVMAAVLREAHTVTSVSTYLAAEAATALGIARDRIPVTPMPLALGVLADLDAARSGAIFVGRLTRQKGVHLLLDAMAVLRRQGLTPQLTVVGDGPELAALKAQARALGLSVTFTGFVAPELVGEHLRDKRVFVLPALEEGLGLVVAEALTQGVPVVATRSGGIPDLILDPDAGMLVPPGDEAALAAAIRGVLLDDRYLGGAIRAGRILADRLSPERVAERFESLYLRMRGGRASAANPRAAP